MKITVEAVSDQDEFYKVHFKCSVGSSVVFADKYHWPHMASESAYVDFDINTSLRIGINTQLINSSGYSICNTDSSVVLTGTIEQQDEDGLVYFRLAPDCLIMIEVEDNYRFDPNQAVSISVKPHEFKATSIGI
jgi:hypothetical protein